MYIIKLGGSVLTDKNKKECFHQEIADRLAKEIKKANKKIILIHGAGSFGHILAKKYQLNDGYQYEQQLLGFSLTHAKVQDLNTKIITILHKNNISAVSLSPHTIMKLNNHHTQKIDYHLIEDFLNSGFVPVTFGDVVLDEHLRFSICSGDLLIQKLAEYFKPEKVIFVIDEDGLYTSNPKTDKNATFIEKATIDELENLSTSANTYADVTQGMKGKIETIKNITNLGIDTILVNGNTENTLYDTLLGNKTKHTLIYGGKK